jgi:hypothetical protein
VALLVSCQLSADQSATGWCYGCTMLSLDPNGMHLVLAVPRLFAGVLALAAAIAAQLHANNPSLCTTQAPV